MDMDFLETTAAEKLNMQQSEVGRLFQKRYFEGTDLIVESSSLVYSVNCNKIYARRLFLGLFNQPCY